MDKRITYWFANRYTAKESYINECTVDKKDFMCCFVVRNEKKVIIDQKVFMEYKIKEVN